MDPSSTGTPSWRRWGTPANFSRSGSFEAKRSVVLAIVRREMGVMTAAALVSAVLGLRAAGWL